jgi:hypothetical protein
MLIVVRVAGRSSVKKVKGCSSMCFDKELMAKAFELLERAHKETGYSFALIEIPPPISIDETALPKVDWGKIAENIADRLGALFESVGAPLKLAILELDGKPTVSELGPYVIPREKLRAEFEKYGTFRFERAITQFGYEDTVEQTMLRNSLVNIGRHPEHGWFIEVSGTLVWSEWDEKDSEKETGEA